jgi:hypothetical protein
MATVFFWTPVNGKNTNSNLSPQGTITVDTAANDGRGTLQIGGGAPNSPYDLRFCANGDFSFTTPPPNCSEVANYTTDGNGAATVHFQMTPPGAFSGVFVIFKNGTAVYGAGPDTLNSGVSFQAALLPTKERSDNSGSGRLTVTGITFHLVLTGGIPTHGFQVFSCTSFPDSGCASVATLQTDPQGNGTTDWQVGGLNLFAWPVAYALFDNEGIFPYVTAFRVR